MDISSAEGPQDRPKTDAVTTNRMSRQKRRDTAPELLLRRELRARGVGYRVNASLPGLPRRSCDVMFKTAQVAVFVDGCFWHGCPEHGTTPKNNGTWWAEKLKKNIARDRDTDRHLTELTWTVIRIWEHEDMSGAADRVVRSVRNARNRAARSAVPAEGT